MDKRAIRLTLISIVIAIILGAFGAHGLKQRLTSEQLNAFQTGVQYQLWNTIVLLIFAVSSSKISWSKLGTILTWLGVGLFSGSIYCITFAHIEGFTFPKFFYLLTPIGGASMIAGYLIQVFKFRLA